MKTGLHPTTAALVILLASLPAGRAVDVLTYHQDNERTGANLQEQILTPANVNSATFGKLFSYVVDGYVYAQPLYVSGLAIPGVGTKNVLFVATEHNTVYALDADSNTGPNGGLLWQITLGQSATTPTSDFGYRFGNFGDIVPEVGITGTPVIDRASGTLFVDTFTHEGNNYFHRLHALDITTGQEKLFPAPVGATVPGTGVGGNGSTVSFDPRQQLQRGALTIAGGILYVPYAGYADTDPYHGWVLGFDLPNLMLQPGYVFNTTPNATVGQFGVNAGEGGIWMAGGGLAVDAANNLYFGVGNGSFNAFNNSGGTEYGDSFIKLSTANGLSVSDYFTPFNQQHLADNDVDFGSGGVLLLPDQAGPNAHLLVTAGKEGKLYLLNRDQLTTGNNHYNNGGNNDSVVQTFSLGLGVFSTPAYFNGHIYIGPANGQLVSVPVFNGTLGVNQYQLSSRVFQYPGVTPTISANGTANGIVWALKNGTPAVLVAYDAQNLANEIYNSTQVAGRDGLANGVKFTTPIVANGKVYTGSRYSVAVFGLLNGNNPPPDVTNTTVWVEDNLPADSVAGADGGDGWTWVSSNPAPFSGTRAHQSNIGAGSHQHYFFDATATLTVNSNDTLITYVYLDPANTPSEIMLQWWDGSSWEHRAYWGANNINYGSTGPTRQFMGALPPTGRWFKLSVPARQVALEGRTLTGMAFTLYGGRATWDYAGKESLSVSNPPPPPTDTVPPTVSITTPANNSVVSGAAVTISATASDNVAVSNVQFRLDGAVLGAPDAAAPYNVSWNTTTNSNGVHQLSAVATDTSGNQMATSVSVTVNNDTTSGTNTTVWVEDDLPADSVAGADGGDGWTWVSSNPAPFSGTRAHQSNIGSGSHQHYFFDATATLTVNSNDTLITYVYLDPVNTPSEIMLQWWDGSSWEHRAYWGANNINYGSTGPTRQFMGALPPTGRWFKLSVPARQVALEGRTLTGMAFTLYGGRATWDYAGKESLSVSNPPPPPPDTVPPTVSITAPANNSVVSGAAVTIAANAGDNVGVANVQFKVDGANVGAADTTTPYSISWNTTTSANGAHQLTAVATDTSGNASTSAAISVTVNNLAPTGSNTVWSDDAVPAGATAYGDGIDTWNWISSNPAPFSGTRAHQSALSSGAHQHYFAWATTGLNVATGGTLFVYIYLDPINPPSEVMLQWWDGTWEHRAYWGANLINSGTDGTVSRQYMGLLPNAGGWEKLSVPASQVGLENRTLTGMSFTLYGGRATWDYAGVTNP